MKGELNVGRQIRMIPSSGRLISLALAGAVFLVLSCGSQPSGEQASRPTTVNVQAGPVIRGDISKTMTFQGLTVCTRQNEVAAPFSGYIEAIACRRGDMVKKGDLLFELVTPENKALIDGKMNHYVRPAKILSPSDGFISSQTPQTGGLYVTDGEILCTVDDAQSLIVQAGIPYEYHNLAVENTACRIGLPDGLVMSGHITRVLPVVDSADQTQTVWVRPSDPAALPENLKVSLEFRQALHRNVLLIPRAALLTNETENEFWVMTVSPDSLALRVPVLTGLSNDSLVEILGTVLAENQAVITAGAYGLPDSSRIHIGHP